MDFFILKSIYQRNSGSKQVWPNSLPNSFTVVFPPTIVSFTPEIIHDDMEVIKKPVTIGSELPLKIFLMHHLTGRSYVIGCTAQRLLRI